MAAAIKMHVIEKGGAPSRAAMVAFGGAGPVYAYNVARKLGIERVLVPLQAGVTSALGLLAAPPAFDLTRTYKVALAELDPVAVEGAFQEMAGAVAGFLRQADAEGDIAFERHVDVSYIGQGYQISLAMPNETSAPPTRDMLWNLFAKEYRAKYGYFYDDVAAEIVKLTVRGSILGRELTLRKLAPGGTDAETALKGERQAFSESEQALVSHRVYDRYRLAPGMVIEGPALIEEAESTTAVDRGGRLEVDGHGTLVIQVAPAERATSGSADVNLDVIWPRLISIAEEMATTQIRTAFSHDVIEVHDMSTGICDARGNLIAQTPRGAPGHTGTMPPLVKMLLEEIPPEEMHPGDSYVTNDPVIAAGHTADVFVVTPAFLDTRLVGFAVSSIHHLDIGGRAGSGLSEEIYEEGLVIPILPIMRKGVPNEEFFKILRKNVRFNEKVTAISGPRSPPATLVRLVWSSCYESKVRNPSRRPRIRSSSGPRRPCAKASPLSPTAPTATSS